MAAAATEQFPPPFPPLPPGLPTWAPNASVKSADSKLPESQASQTQSTLKAAPTATPPMAQGSLPPPPPMLKPVAPEYPKLSLLIPKRLVAAGDRFENVEREDVDAETKDAMAKDIVLELGDIDVAQLVVRGASKDDIDTTLYAMLRAFERLDVSGNDGINDEQLKMALLVPHSLADILLKDSAVKLKELCRACISPVTLAVNHRVNRAGAFARQLLSISGFPEALHQILPEVNSLVQEEEPKCARQAELTREAAKASAASAPPTAASPKKESTAESTPVKDGKQVAAYMVPAAAEAGAAAVRAAPWLAPAAPWTAGPPAGGTQAEPSPEKPKKKLARPSPGTSAGEPPKKKSTSDGRAKKEKRSDARGGVGGHADSSTHAAAAPARSSASKAPNHTRADTARPVVAPAPGPPPGIPPPTYPSHRATSSQAGVGPWGAAHAYAHPSAVGSPFGAAPQHLPPAYGHWPPNGGLHYGAPHPSDATRSWMQPAHARPPYNGQPATGGGTQVIGGTAGGEHTLHAWLRSLDGGRGDLLMYHEALVENFETVEDLAEVERGHDGSVPDRQFFEDLGVTRSDHREIFRRWFAYRLQQRGRY